MLNAVKQKRGEGKRPKVLKMENDTKDV